MKFTVAVAMTEPSEYLELARMADEYGYHAAAVPDAVFFPERVDVPYPYTSDGQRFWEPDTPWIDPFVAIPAMAAVPRRLRFCSHVLKLPIRNPLLVAKTVGSTAVLSDNRVVLGVGLSWIPQEFVWCGTEFETRGERANEAIEILQLLFAGGMVEYHGKHYSFDRLQMSPAPSKPVPIYVGGHSEPALRRAARYGDGWTAAMIKEREIPAIITRLTALRRELGRDQLPFEIQVACTDVFDLEGYKRLEGQGVSDVLAQPWLFYGAGMRATLDEKRDGLRRFADDVMAKLP
ncbi:MAG TPA: TIGR03619 family F420-dependent LLM class oxidoreductase [Polyangiaceae bacterium]|nr:TIGR03619 family F420-dependent LLM class oxidoreductase [Polyangiaceae bacterium]